MARRTIVLTHDHSIDYGFRAAGIERSHEYKFIKDVYIGDNVFVGQKCIILPGTVIGNNCIIGAGSVVSGSIPENSIYAGSPARYIANSSEWAKRKQISDSDNII